MIRTTGALRRPVPSLLPREVMAKINENKEQLLDMAYCPLHKELKISKSGRDVSPARSTYFSRDGPPWLPFVSQRL